MGVRVSPIVYIDLYKTVPVLYPINTIDFGSFLSISGYQYFGVLGTEP